MRTVGVLRALHAFLVKPPTVFYRFLRFSVKNGDRYRFPEAHSAKNGDRYRLPEAHFAKNGDRYRLPEAHFAKNGDRYRLPEARFAKNGDRYRLTKPGSGEKLLSLGCRGLAGLFCHGTNGETLRPTVEVHRSDGPLGEVQVDASIRATHATRPILAVTAHAHQ